MGVPDRGALVEVTLIGEVREARGGSFLLRVGGGFDATDHWLPEGAAVKVLQAAMPREVLLLECGHVMDHPRPESTAGTAYCWRFPCHAHKAVVGVSSVNW